MDIVDELREDAQVNRNSENVPADGSRCLSDRAADEIENLRRVILSALDCLHHDDAKGARKVLSAD